MEEEFGAFGTVYYGDDGQDARIDPVRAGAALPARVGAAGGPPSEDAMLVTCAYLVDASSPWVLQSLFLAAIGEARDRGVVVRRGVRVPLRGG